MRRFIRLQQSLRLFQEIFTPFAVAPIFREKSHILIVKGIDLFQSNFFRRQLQLFQQQFSADFRQGDAV